MLGQLPPYMPHLAAQMVSHTGCHEPLDTAQTLTRHAAHQTAEAHGHAQPSVGSDATADAAPTTHDGCGSCSSCEVCHGVMLTAWASASRLYPVRAGVQAPPSTYASVTHAPSHKPPIA